MSRRKRAAPAPAPREGAASRERPASRGEPSPRDGRPEPAGVASRRILRDIGILAVVFGVAVGIAELAGAANLGVSFGIGQIAFAIALAILLTRG